MRYFALDLETANQSFSSICQIGIARFDDGVYNGVWNQLINPKQPFSSFNESIHGITAKKVSQSPTFSQVYPKLKSLIENQFVIHHSAFDRSALSQAYTKNKLKEIPCTMVDSALAARMTWEEFSQSGYGLHDLASAFDIQFQHHDAAEDARAAGIIMWKTVEKSGVPLEHWPDHFRNPSRWELYKRTEWKDLCDAEPDPSGPLFGEVIVFTGELSMDRVQAAKMASNVGCNVDNNITKSTTVLVVGVQDLTVMAAGQTKSTKHRRAEQLIAGGQKIKIITEQDFLSIVSK
jgi:DNA polymerase-3 subunit epsilon